MTARFAPAIFFALALVAMLALTLGAPLNHDEHQFIASAALGARDGLLPYRDFPYFHTPNLVGIYALLFQATDHLLLAARVFSTLCAWLIGVALYAFARRHSAAPIAAALGIAALFLANPVTAYTFPKAWNNPLPALLLVLAFLAQCRGTRPGATAWLFASGFLVAFAAGVRISFAPLALPFLVLAGFTPGRLRAVAACFAGMIVASLPPFFLLASAPAEFLFDNLLYNSRINALYRLASGDERNALASKAFFILKVLVNPGNAAALALAVAALWPIARHGRTRYPVALLFAILPFALLGVYAPTPSYSQYYSVLAALAALAVALGWRQNLRGPLAASVLISVIAAAVQNSDSLARFATRAWTPFELHAEGRTVRELAGPGPILTLAPIVPLEGGSSIYPAFATGSFAWRTSAFLSAEDRQRYGFVAEPELAALLAAHPPAGILLGHDRKREEAFLNYAKTHRYRRIKLSEKKTLWLPPNSPNESAARKILTAEGIILTATPATLTAEPKL